MQAVEQAALLGRIDQAHGGAFEAKSSELFVADFDEDVDDSIAETADGEVFHGASRCDQGRIEDLVLKLVGEHCSGNICQAICKKGNIQLCVDEKNPLNVSPSGHMVGK